MHGPMSDERQALLEEAAELLRWEHEIGGIGVPPIELEPRPSRPSLETQKLVPEPPPPEVTPVPSAGSAPQGAEDRAHRLRVLQQEAASCTKCGLHQGRTESVFARGNPKTDLVFVGEGPGYHEDQQGLPFVGNAGALLDRMVKAMGYPRDGVYICNVVKCRPPQNRTPKPGEAGACKPYLVGQLEAIRPKVIVALGRCAAENLGQVEPGGRGWRGRWGEYEGIPVMSTYHPAFLLRSPQFKRPVWDDLKNVLRKLGRPIP
jgi:uracil-DNA glycosylase family 4